MSILTEPAPRPRIDPRRKCGTCDWLATLKPEELAHYERLRVDARAPGYSYTLRDLLSEMQESGYPLQYPALSKHLSGLSCVTR